jgi:hypothetical protein
MVMWQETELFIQQNVLLLDLTILFINWRLQRPNSYLTTGLFRL